MPLANAAMPLFSIIGLFLLKQKLRKFCFSKHAPARGLGGSVMVVIKIISLAL